MQKMFVLLFLFATLPFSSELVTVTCSFEAVAEGFDDITISSNMVTRGCDENGKYCSVYNGNGSEYRLVEPGGSIFFFPEAEYISEDMTLVSESIIHKSKTKKNGQKFVFDNLIHFGSSLYGSGSGSIYFFIKKGVLVSSYLNETFQSEYGETTCVVE